MDITKYVVEYREAAFLLGDYSTYRAQLTRRLRIVQKKLGRATPKNAKYAAKAPVTAGDIATNIECVLPPWAMPVEISISMSIADCQGSCTSCCSPQSGRGRTPWP
jgi:hypothetical protein